MSGSTSVGSDFFCLYPIKLRRPGVQSDSNIYLAFQTLGVKDWN